MKIQATDCILVMGRRGCGKSFLAKRLQSIWPRRVIVDTLNEYSGQNVAFNFQEFSEKLIKLKSENSKKFELIFQFNPENENSEAEFNELLRLCYYFSNIQIVIEEVQLFSSPHFLPKWLKNCLLIGRHQNLSVLCTSQRPGEVNKTILSQCAHIFCGNIIEGNDLKYISNFLNLEAKKLVSLPDRKFIYFSREGIREISNKF